MVRYRPPNICPFCGIEIKAKYRDQSHLPIQLQLIGDTFEGYEPHDCEEAMGALKDVNIQLPKGIIAYFIEHKETRLWWYGTLIPVEDGRCYCRECNPQGRLQQRYKDGWTKDPLKASKFNTKKEAQNAIWFNYTNESENNLMVTEHEFINQSK